MKLEKTTVTHKIFKRGDDRFAVRTRKGEPVNGEEKIALLIAEGLVTAPEPKAAPEPEPEVEAEPEAEVAAEAEPEAEPEEPAKD